MDADRLDGVSGMADQQDRELLLSIFLMEAWDSVATIEDGLGRLDEVAASRDGAADPMVVVAHRLKGAAGLHGFPGVASLGGAIEAILEGSAGLPPGGDPGAFVADAVATLKKALDAIAATEREDEAEIAAFRARYPAAFEATPLPSAAAPATVSSAVGARHPLLADMDRFFAENADILAYFAPEAAEHLEVMTKSLMSLEAVGPSEQELHTLFRAVHTLKGAAYTVGCSAVGDLAHQIEDLLVAVREGRAALTPLVVERVLAGTDALKLLLEMRDTSVDVPEIVGRAVAGLLGVMPGVAAPAAAALESGSTAEVAPVASSLPVPLAPRGEPISVGSATPAEPQAAGDKAVSSVRSTIRVNLDRLDALMNLVGELVTARSRLDQRFLGLGRIDGLLAFCRSRMAQAVRDFEGRHYDPQIPQLGSGLGGGPGTGASRPAAENFAGLESVEQLFAELEFDRYDDFNILARSIGEISADLSETQAQLTALIQSIRDDTGQIQRLTGSLRTEITRARMVPIGQLYARFARQLREASKAAGKTVVLEPSGESVEVDNSIIEQIADPLLHLIQNAVTHGIEPEAERRARGKPAYGTVYLSAYHRGGAIYVEVEDDGRGIDVTRIKERAIEQGLLRPEAAPLLSEREALNLIFLPGFSTATHVTTAAGRGVGMDVVRTNVARLNGEIEVETEVGVGTRFTLRLPLTVVIFDVLMVRASTETLVVPLNAIRLIRNVRSEEIQTVGRSEMVRIEDAMIPVVRLDRALALSPSEPGPRVPLLVLRAGGRSFAAAVDTILSKEEIVIKRLGGFAEGVGPFTGATISGDGRVILLLDPGRLFALGDAAAPPPHPVPAVRSVPQPPADGPRPAEAPRRVLLVDDSISVRRFVGHMLEKSGFQVTTANDGAEALERLAEAAFEVVVTDLEMPRVNGYELIEDLRRRPSTRNLPVVVLTTRAGEKHWSLARRLGVKHYATKPVDEQAFVRLIDGLTATAAAGEPALGGALR